VVSCALLAGANQALAAQSGPAAQAAHLTAAPSSGSGAPAKAVNVRALAAARQLPAHGWNNGPLGKDGQPAGSNLPVGTDTGRKPVPAAPSAAGPNIAAGTHASAARLAPPAPAARRPQVMPARPMSVTQPGLTTAPRTPPTLTNTSFIGVQQPTADCNNCQPPDPNAAVGSNQIVEAVNLEMEVFGKTGGFRCDVGLNTFLGTAQALSDPRVQWDNLNNRYSMVVTVIPNATDTPALYVAASQTTDACGAWWVYRMSFTGPFYPAGTLLDYPYLGQDQTSLLFSSNNFCCGASSSTYLESAAFSIAKSLIYSGAPVSFTCYGVAFSTAPVTVSGIPIAATTNTYFLASVPGVGYELYVMPSVPNSPIVLQATVSAPFNAPTRRVRQPRTTQTLDPLDGRIQWAPVQSQNFVWFTHVMDLGGFPAIRYGAISVVSNTAFVATAYHSVTSDDFNPSIGVADAGSNVIYAWLNWAYTDTPNGLATSDTVDGVLPGAGTPNLFGTDLTIKYGAPTSTNFRFGDYSSVEVDPMAASATCPAGRTAVVNQEYFTSHNYWSTRLSRLSFC
jgi:hypothetical protein